MASAGMSANKSAEHRKLVKEMAEQAKARRAKKGRGNGKRYLYNGVKVVGKLPFVGDPGMAQYYGKDNEGRPVNA